MRLPSIVVKPVIVNWDILNVTDLQRFKQTKRRCGCLSYRADVCPERGLLSGYLCDQPGDVTTVDPGCDLQPRAGGCFGVLSVPTRPSSCVWCIPPDVRTMPPAAQLPVMPAMMRVVLTPS